MAQEVLRPKEKPATVALLNGRVVNLLSKKLCLFHQPVLFSSSVSEAAFGSGPGLMPKLNSCLVKILLSPQTQMGHLYHIPLPTPQGSENIIEEKVKRI